MDRFVIGLLALAFAGESLSGENEMMMTHSSFVLGLPKCHLFVVLEQLPLYIEHLDERETVLENKRYTYHQDISLARVLCSLHQEPEGTFKKVATSYRVYSKGEVMVEFANVYDLTYTGYKELVTYDFLKFVHDLHTKNAPDVKESIVVRNYPNQLKVFIYFKASLHTPKYYLVPGKASEENAESVPEKVSQENTQSVPECFKISYLESPNTRDESSQWSYPTIPIPVEKSECQHVFENRP